MAVSPAAYANNSDLDDNRVTLSHITSHPPLATAHIQKYEIAEAAAGSDYETGNLRITYDNAQQVIEKLPPIQKSTNNSIICNVVGFSDPKVAEDKRTIGWTEKEGGSSCFTTYSITGEISVYRSGRTVLHIYGNQVVWFWMFRDGGKHLAAVWGATHGPEYLAYQLYDTSTGKMVAQAFSQPDFGSPDLESLDAGAPEWARETRQAMHQER
jgi:hypothetical protein